MAETTNTADPATKPATAANSVSTMMNGEKKSIFTIPADAKTTPWHNAWQFCVGSGHAALALRTDWRDQLARVHRDLGIKRVRFHGIFCDDMGTYVTLGDLFGDDPRMPELREINFDQIGVAYDNVISAGMDPFVELSFMPSHLASKTTTGTFFYRPNITPPKDEAAWSEFVRRFVRFLLHRYGQERVRRWYFEVWNEPDIPVTFFDGTQEQYFRLYAATCKAVKEVDPHLRVGGPATSGSRWITDFVDYCEKNDVPFDFISTHQYAGDPLSGVSEEEQTREDQQRVMQERKNTAEAPAETDKQDKDQEKAQASEQQNVDPQQLAQLFSGLPKEDGILPFLQRVIPDSTETDDLDRDVFMKAARRTVDEAHGRPVFYTEWNATGSFGNPASDSRKVAAYDVRTAIASDDIIDGSSIWCFSDIFEEMHQFPQEFHGGFGLQTQHGIRKPVYYALQRLTHVGDERYVLPGALDGTISMAAFRSPDRLTVVLDRQDLRFAAHKDDPLQSAEVRIALPVRPERVTIARIDETHGNPRALWEKMGSPMHMNRQEIEKIDTACEVRDEPMDFDYKSGTLFLTSRLGVDDVQFITVTLGKDE